MNAPVEKNSLPSYNHFVFFHEVTNGSAGRAVYIDPNLLTRFIDLLGDPKKNPEQTKTVIVNGIFELRHSAGGITSDSNSNNAFEHRQVFGDVMVIYHIFQNRTENNHGGGVYITQLLRASGKRDHFQPGLYEITQKSDIDDPWDYKVKTDNAITTPMAAIGAVFNEGAYDFNATTDNIGDYLLKNGSWKASNTYSLYYSPSYIIDQLGTWKSAEQKIENVKSGPEELSEILINTQTKAWSTGGNQSKYKWYIFGDGAKILDTALSKVKQRANASLSIHEFYFIAPKGNLGLLLSCLNSLGAGTFKNASTLGTSGNGDFSVQVHQANNISDLAEGYKQYQIQSPNIQTNLTPMAEEISAYKTAFAKNPLDKTFAQMVNAVAAKKFG